MTSRDPFAFNYRKLEELIVCIAEKVPDIGMTKLEKLLYLCDFVAAERAGRPVTGEVYRNFDMGPVPKHIKAVLRGMKDQIREEVIQLKNGRSFRKFTPLRRCDLSRQFDDNEQKLVLDILQEFGSWSANDLVEYVHQDLTYLLTRRNEDIPYFLAPYRRYKKPTRAEAEQLLENPDYVSNLRTAFA
jgi:uncharacterized phage-associated protein